MNLRYGCYLHEMWDGLVRFQLYLYIQIGIFYVYKVENFADSQIMKMTYKYGCSLDTKKKNAVFTFYDRKIKLKILEQRFSVHVSTLVSAMQFDV